MRLLAECTPRAAGARTAPPSGSRLRVLWRADGEARRQQAAVVIDLLRQAGGEEDAV